jgi:hypothetical protein
VIRRAEQSANSWPRARQLQVTGRSSGITFSSVPKNGGNSRSSGLGDPADQAPTNSAGVRNVRIAVRRIGSPGRFVRFKVRRPARNIFSYALADTAEAEMQLKSAAAT